MFKVQALTFMDCEVVASYRLLSLDDNHYICKNQNYQTEDDSIFYDSGSNTIKLSQSNIYYFTNYDSPLTIDVIGDNSITMVHLNSSITITGNGSIKFREDSYNKRVNNGEKVYRYEINGKTVVNQDKKIYEGTLTEFTNIYKDIYELNGLPVEFKEEDYNLVQVDDFINMIPVFVTPSWIDTYIITDNDTNVENGYATIKGKEEKVEEEKVEEKKEEEVKKENNSTTLTNENVTLVSEKKLNKKYKLKVSNLKEEKEELKKSVEEGDILSLYDISIYKGKRIVSVKDGKYIIKIKINEDDEVYDNYQIIYVSKDGEIKEYLEGRVEDGYIVFETTHLSKYGIIGKNNPKEEIVEEIVNKEVIPKKESNILQLSIMIGCTIICIIVISFVIYKSKHINGK